MNFFQIRKKLSESDFSKFDIEDRIAMEISNSFYDWFMSNETVPKSKENDFCSMFHEPSSSPISFNDVNVALDEYKKNLEKDLIKIVKANQKMDPNKEMIEFAIWLFELDEIITICEFEGKPDTKEKALKIFKNLNTNIKNEKKLCEFLKSSLCFQKLASYFEDIVDSELLLLENKFL